MNRDKLKDIAELIGFASIVVSLVFVGMEVRQSRLASVENSLASSSSLVIDTESLVLSHPDVWRRGCIGEPLDPKEEVVFSRIHHAYTFEAFFRWSRATRGIAESSAALAVDNIAMNIYRYPGFRSEWEAHGKSRQHIGDIAPFQVFRQLVDERVDQFPGFEPVPVSDVSRCGLN